MKRKIISIFSVFMFAFMLLIPISSAKNVKTMNVTKDFVTQSKPLKQDFDKVIEKKVDGKNRTEKYYLKNVKYELINQKTVATITKANLIDNSYELGQTIKVDNIDFVITDIQKATNLKTQRNGEFSGSVDLGYYVNTPKAERKKTFKVYDEETKKYVNTTLDFTNFKATTKSWKNDFQTTLELIGVDKRYLTCQGVYLDGENVFDEIMKKQDIILSATKTNNNITLNGKDYVIEKLDYQGDVYKNANGDLCRKVKATGKRNVAYYTAIYGSKKADLPNANEFTYTITAERNGEIVNVANAKPNYKVKATAIYDTEKPKATMRERYANFKENLSDFSNSVMGKTLWTILGVGTVVCLIVIGLYLKKQNKNKDE